MKPSFPLSRAASQGPPAAASARPEGRGDIRKVLPERIFLTHRGLGGYRLMLHRRFGVDLKAGYDYSGARVNTSYFEQAGFRGSSWSRHSLSLGMGLVF